MLAQGVVQTGVLATHSVGFACIGLSLQTIPDLRHPHHSETRRAFCHPKAEGGFVRSVAYVCAGCDPPSIRVSGKAPIDFSVCRVGSGAESFSSHRTLWVISRSLQKLEARGFILPLVEKLLSHSALMLARKGELHWGSDYKSIKKNSAFFVPGEISGWILTDTFAPTRCSNQDWPKTKFLCSVFWILEM